MYIALYKNGRYYKEKVEDGHIVSRDCSEEKFAEIYDLYSKTWYNIQLTEELLESLSIPNLGYIKTDEGFEVYDTSKEKYEEEVLPVYVDVFGSIKKSKKSVEIKIPTKESVEASKAICAEVEKCLMKLKHEKDISIIKEKIERGDGIAYINTRTNYISNLLDVLYAENLKMLFSSNGHCVIGNVAKTPNLKLYVPEKIVPMIIGKGGQMIKKIAEEIGAKKINVKPIRN